MEQLIAHLLGDYVLQNHWMANKKTQEWLPALVHVFLYSLPFLLLTQSPLAMAVIVGTHLIIDRYRLAAYWVDFWGTGKKGWVGEKLGVELEDSPAWLGVWLLFIVDNTMHLCINYAALRWL